MGNHVLQRSFYDCCVEYADDEDDGAGQIHVEAGD